MLVKELLEDLETGDRTTEHLETKEVENSSLNQIPQLQNLFNQQQALHNHNQYQYQVFQGAYGNLLGQGQITGGIRPW